MHAGRSREDAKALGRVNLEAAAFELGGREDVAPGEFMLELTGLARDRVRVLSRMLGQAFAEEVARATAAGGVAAAGVASVGPPGAGAFVGHRYVLDSAGNRVAVGEAVRGLAAYEQAWVELAAKLAKTAVDAKLVDAQADVLALMGGQLQQIIDSVVSALGHDPNDPEVVRVVAERLAVVGAGDDEGGDAP